jgi:hypothetical protein
VSTNQPERTAPKRNRWLPFAVGIPLVLLAAYLGWYYATRTGKGYNEQSVPLTFDGASDLLQTTVVLPTLDTPIPDGKSAVWCASFQLAWNRLKDDVAQGPIQLANAQGVADRLNAASQSADDLQPDSVYAAAGLVKDNIVGRIQSEMARKFPRVPQPQLEAPLGGAVAYAYLAAATKFDIPFFENDERFLFKDSTGKQTAVGSFGIRRSDDYAYPQLRKQIEVLYCPREYFWSEKEIPEFIVDPCKTSRPFQLMLARVDRKATLTETLADIERKMVKPPSDERKFYSDFHPRDALLIPNMAWKVNHRFREVEGADKQFQNPTLRGLYLDTALQSIQFRLDRSGAELSSEAKQYVKPSASFFEFDRPFLIILKKREAKHPFFVMWVDNAELLQKR